MFVYLFNLVFIIVILNIISFYIVAAGEFMDHEVGAGFGLNKNES